MITIYEGHRYRVQQDHIGGVVLGRIDTGQSCYFQGDDAEELRIMLDQAAETFPDDSWKLIEHTDWMLSEYDSVLDRGGAL